MTNLKLISMIAAGFAIGVGLVTYSLSFVFIPSFIMPMSIFLIPLAPLFISAIILLIKES